MTASSSRDPHAALHAMALEYKSADGKTGVAALAHRMGRSPGVMYNKFSDHCETAALTLRDALAIQDATDSDALAEAIAATRGGIFVKLPDLGGAADDDVLTDFLALIDKEGVLARTLTEARADGLIESHEFDAVRADADRLIAAVHRLLVDLRSQVRTVQDGKLVRVAA